MEPANLVILVCEKSLLMALFIKSFMKIWITQINSMLPEDKNNRNMLFNIFL